MTDLLNQSALMIYDTWQCLTAFLILNSMSFINGFGIKSYKMHIMLLSRCIWTENTFQNVTENTFHQNILLFSN